jgi:membrane protein required for colicin V production
MMPITLLDINLLAVMLFSGLLGASRGLLRIAVAVVCCAAALLVPVSLVAIHGVFFLAALIVLLVAARFSPKIFDERVNIVDRVLGFLFGLVRGVWIVAVAFLFYSLQVRFENRPEWIKQGKSQVVLQETGLWLMSMVPTGGPEQGSEFVLMWIAVLILMGVVLSIVVDFFVIITRRIGY